MAFCWYYYIQTHNIRDVELKEVEKALGCYGQGNGCFVYWCSHCDTFIFQSLGCNSRICSCCGKRYADTWALALSKRMFKIPHRHFVISIASELWSYLQSDRKLWKTYMDSVIDTLDDYVPKLMHKKHFRVGAIVILHPFGKDMKFQPHLHLIITEGGFDENKNWIPCKYFPANGLAECWKYHVCKNLSQAGVPFKITDWCFRNKRFYVWIHKDGTINSPKQIARYLGRYVRHPAIANSRIDSFDVSSDQIHFHYENHMHNKIDVVMSQNQFIDALLQHIPEPQFKMIRYYGTYARRTKKIFKSYLQSSIEQKLLLIYGVKKPEKIFYCQKCGEKLQFVDVMKKPPPKSIKLQTELLDWFRVNY